MILYFTNSSKQKKMLIETDYVEDVLDGILAFLEEYRIRPHFMCISANENRYIITWESWSEMFVCEGMTEEDSRELKKLMGELVSK